MYTLLFENTIVYILIAGLCSAAAIDLYARRVPNFLVLVLFLFGIFSQCWFGGINGFLYSIAGTGVALLLLFPLYCVGGLGAGDVKLMAAAGAYMDGTTALLAVVLSINVATVIGFFILIISGGLLAYLQRYFLMAKTGFVTGRVIYIPPARDEAANKKFPCAIAIAAGCVAAIYFDHLLILL